MQGIWPILATAEKRTILVSFLKAGSSRMQPWEE
jgi:hypothetical protein